MEQVKGVMRQRSIFMHGSRMYEARILGKSPLAVLMIAGTGTDRKILFMTVKRNIQKVGM